MYPLYFILFPHICHYRALSRVLWAIQWVLISHLFIYSSIYTSAPISQLPLLPYPSSNHRFVGIPLLEFLAYFLFTNFCSYFSRDLNSVCPVGFLACPNCWVLRLALRALFFPLSLLPMRENRNCPNAGLCLFQLRVNSDFSAALRNILEQCISTLLCTWTHIHGWRPPRGCVPSS